MIDGSLILIVDDSRDLQDLYQLALQSEGYFSHVVASGEDALAFLATHQQPQAIILDNGLTGMSGLELLEVLSTAKTWQSIPVIFSSADGSLKAEALALGARHFFRKPLDLDLFLAALGRFRKVS